MKNVKNKENYEEEKKKKRRRIPPALTERYEEMHASADVKRTRLVSTFSLNVLHLSVNQ